MRIAILGAGAMGSLFGGLLAEAGEDVTLIDVNDAHLDAIRRVGLRIENDRGERRITTLRAVRSDAAQPARGEPFDLLIVFTKSLHTRAALDGVRALLAARTAVLTLQNGLGNVETLRAFVPPERILVGVTTWPADFVGPGHVRSHGAGAIRMMTADGATRPIASAAAAALTRAGLACELDADVWAAIWEKVAFNAALNTLCAVTGCTVDQLGACDDGPRIALAIVAETAAVARAKGIAVDPERIADKVRHAIDAHRGHRPSMLQDVLAGRRTEIDAINGAVVAAAREAGVAVPHTETLLGLVRLIDARHA
ncbi:ketopantoate reductase family protein [Burkholderia ubonensis]|uniref:ketopantoate reductase family protein n=1 Tax=Burkholderia ubonensis TaxID=101571 RepID=UPI0007559ED1|nr:2-dehydropantoate 2-reductase [Burkholderia ubonensis]AOI71323.1 2-dehydropantoate 2-reductase [Burkholderia ubonensis]KUZ21443.1 2-dehydropantoate 2-reductase [Burkholderia ubonensis]KUZ22853.1 2-dehydropantoate 2-reductase [Burkholderia ubonensis]KUZ26857.1 2-dehydropantoate 2-reductase [Burkholderia ubonensis]KUZ46270.1 2-dehydropantoate 2-reductase [Burkholderia ubonensis]